MTGPNLEPLSDDLRELIGEERNRSGMPDEARARLMAKLGLPPGGVGGGPGNSNGPSGSSSVRGGARGAPASGPRHIRLVRPGWFGATTFALGLVGGAIVHAVYDHNVAPAPLLAEVGPLAKLDPPPSVAVVVVPRAPAPAVAPAKIEAQAKTPAAAPDAPTAILAVPSRHHSPTPFSSPSSSLSPTDARKDSSERDVDLGTERALVEIARTSLSRGQSEAAITALQRHARQFPRGRLGEERDSLWVQALVQVGRGSEARSRAERFRSQFPTSLLLPAVDAALKSIP